MKLYKMKTPRIKKEYMYLIIVLLLGLILSSFIKPLMEGFKEGADGSQTSYSKDSSPQPPSITQIPACASGFIYSPDKKLCIGSGKCSDKYRLDMSGICKISQRIPGAQTYVTPTCISVPGKTVTFSKDDGNKCIYTP